MDLRTALDSEWRSRSGNGRTTRNLYHFALRMAGDQGHDPYLGGSGFKFKRCHQDLRL
jgi:hypothetical protein